MMKNPFNYLKTALLLLMLFFTLGAFAQTETPEVSPALIVQYLTPFIVLGVTAIIRFAKPAIPGWATMLVVSALSAAVAWITNVTIGGDMSFLLQTAYGLLAVTINQFYRQFTGGNTAAKKA